MKNNSIRIISILASSSRKTNVSREKHWEKLRKWNVYLESKRCGESSLESNCYNATMYYKGIETFW